MNTDTDALKKNPRILQLYASRVKLTRNGREMEGVCPFHTEKTGSFKVSEKDGALLWYCFGCGAGGDIFKFVEKLDNLSFKAAAEKVREFCGSAERVDQVFQPVSKEEKPATTFTLAQWAKFEKNLAASQAAQDWLLKERGIVYDTAKKMRVGFVRRVNVNEPPSAGWIAFPCIENGLVVSIKYRALARKEFVRQPGMKTSLFGLEF